MEIQHLYDMIERQTDVIDKIHNDLTDIKIELEVIRRTGLITPKRDRVKETAAGGGIGALFMALVVGAWEFFQKH